MPYKKFLPYSILGGVLWIFSMTLAGYYLGGLVENALGIRLEDHIEKVVIVVVALSLLPPLIEYLKHRSARKKAVAEEIEKAEI
jgi:membrane-associated protein